MIGQRGNGFPQKQFDKGIDKPSVRQKTILKAAATMNRCCFCVKLLQK